MRQQQNYAWSCDSVPEELDEITRRLKQLEIEREAIKREDDKEKIAQLDKEIAELKEQEHSFRAKWEGRAWIGE